MRKYLVKRAYVMQEEFYHLEVGDNLVEEVKDRIKSNEDFNLTEEEVQLIDEKVLFYCFSNIAQSKELYDELTKEQKELVNKRSNGDGDFYDLANCIEYILDEFIWDVDCEYGDSEVNYCDNYVECY